MNDLVMSNKGCRGAATTDETGQVSVIRNGGGDKVNLREKVLDIQSVQQEKVELEKKLAGNFV